MNYVNLRYYKNLTKANNPTSTLVNRSVFYYGYGTNTTLENGEVIYPTEERGDWYSPQGQEKYGDVLTWASGNALNHKYTYTMILSLRDGQMEPEDFIEAMNETAENYFDDYRLIVHYDTNHDHAHVMAFRDTVLRRGEFDRFRLEMRDKLSSLEEQRILEQDVEPEKGISIQQEMDWEDDLEL